MALLFSARVGFLKTRERGTFFTTIWQHESAGADRFLRITGHKRDEYRRVGGGGGISGGAQ